MKLTKNKAWRKRPTDIQSRRGDFLIYLHIVVPLYPVFRQIDTRIIGLVDGRSPEPPAGGGLEGVQKAWQRLFTPRGRPGAGGRHEPSTNEKWPRSPSSLQVTLPPLWTVPLPHVAFRIPCLCNTESHSKLSENCKIEYSALCEECTRTEGNLNQTSKAVDSVECVPNRQGIMGEVGISRKPLVTELPQWPPCLNRCRSFPRRCRLVRNAPKIDVVIGLPFGTSPLARLARFTMLLPRPLPAKFFALVKSSP